MNRAQIDEEDFKKHWEAGLYKADIAFLHGVSIASVTNWAKRLGLPPRKPGKPMVHVSSALPEGEWVTRRGVKVFVPKYKQRSK